MEIFFMANGKNTTKGFNSQDFSIQKFNHEQFGEITGITLKFTGWPQFGQSA
jgi:hypothetical protein